MKDVQKMVDDALANGEMVFVVRSRDVYSDDALIGYYRACIKAFGKEHPFTQDIAALLKSWKEWQGNNYCKLQEPKLPKKAATNRGR